ncbi:MAG: primosomal protein N' [Lachnospiraceae bacterium]|nr:primosomal protein N' [Lachnospiraceae bacterium]
MDFKENIDKKRFACIIIDISSEKVDRTFQYRIPEDLRGSLSVGMRVNVPFGNGKRTGYIVRLSDTPEIEESRIRELYGVVKGSVPVEERMISLAAWMKDRFGGTMNHALKTVLLVPAEKKRRKKKQTDDPGEQTRPVPVSLVELNESQKRAAERILTDWKKGIRGTYLLHGVTGSGKTEVYIEVMKAVVRKGKQVVFLIPEIALTFQTVRRLRAHFGERVAILNSRMSAGERYEQYRKAKDGEIDVMVGPRSALFTPFAEPAFFILDEEHETSYKSESLPRYHARETAIRLAEICGASVILGSATPSVDSFYKARNGEYTYLELPERAADRSMAETEIVDMRNELREGNRSILSRRLREEMERTLAAGEQSMLFLNRRGVSGFVSCRSCGEVMKCPHCDVSLSLHRNQTLVCHYCGYRTPMIKTCPKCGSRYIGTFRAGTEKAEDMVREAFPGARILRMDTDTTRGKEGHERILGAFSRHEADILIGTQMIVKGHDFPTVTLVGILAADMSLYAPDFHAGERTFQLLTQAAGRAGRGEAPGRVLIQTYQPEHYSIRCAAAQDYQSFYEEEIAFRRLMRYPPVWHFLQILSACTKEEEAERGAGIVASLVREAVGEEAFVTGPVDAVPVKRMDLFRKVVFIKSPSYDMLVKAKDHTESCFSSREELSHILIRFDFDPMNGF